MIGHPKPQVVKCPAFLAYVRTLPCVNKRKGCNCGRQDTMGSGLSEASHLLGKSRDDRVLPMSGNCHRTGPFSWHKGKQSFMTHWGWTEDELLGLAEALWDTYTTEGK